MPEHKEIRRRAFTDAELTEVAEMFAVDAASEIAEILSLKASTPGLRRKLGQIICEIESAIRCTVECLEPELPAVGGRSAWHVTGDRRLDAPGPQTVAPRQARSRGIAYDLS